MHLKRLAVLIIGGYGKVGQAIALQLAGVGKYELTIAGRNKTVAAKFAKQVSAAAVSFDIAVVGATEKVLVRAHDVVLVCVDQDNTALLAFCISEGKTYFDITAQRDFIMAAKSLQFSAQQHGAFVLTSLGLCPGWSNLMVKAMMERHPEAEAFNVGILLGLGEKHGKAAIDWTLDNLRNDFEYDGHKQNAFGAALLFSFAGLGRHRAYRFNFSDQHSLKVHHPEYDFGTYLCFDKKWISWLLYFLQKAGLKRLLHFPVVFRMAAKAFAKPVIGTPVFALTVQAQKGFKILGSMSFQGKEEALVTAKLAFESIHHLLQSGKYRQAGVFDIQEVMSLSDIQEKILPNFETVENA